MSFFNKMLASIGIGFAKVDTRLEKSSLRRRNDQGEVAVYGGNGNLQINMFAEMLDIDEPWQGYLIAEADYGHMEAKLRQIVLSYS